MNKLLLWLITAALAGLTIHAQAAMSVTGSGAGPFDFSTLPTPAEGWSVTNIAGANTLYGTTAQLDAGVTALTASNIRAAMVGSATVPPSTFINYRWNSAGFYIQCRPTGNAASILVLSLTNETGGDVTSMTLSYNFAELAGNPGEELPGWRAYYSLTGEPGTYTVIPEFSTGAVGALSATLNLTWPANTAMYVMWADDNANSGNIPPQLPGSEGAYTLDNFAITAAIAGQSLVIRGNPADQTVFQGDPASFNVTITGSTPQFQWLKGNGAGGFTNIPGATNMTLMFTNAQVIDDANYYVAVTNSISATNSAVVHLTVIPDVTPPLVTSALGDWNMTNILVSFSERLNPATVDTSKFTLTTVGGATTLNVSAATLVNSNSDVLLTTQTRVVGTNYTLTVLPGIKDRNNNATTNSTVITPLHTEVRLLAISGTEWKYRAEGIQQPADWFATGFNDGAWPVGPSPFDGKRPTARTTLAVSNSTAVAVGTQLLVTNLASPFTTNAIATMYFRTHFFFPGSSAGVTAKVHTLWDDGAVLYLNSQEAHRLRVPTTNESFLAYNVVGGPADPIPNEVYDFPLTNINANADNTVAVLLKQVSASNSDITMAVELIATFPGFSNAGSSNTPPTVSLTGPTNNQMFIAPASILLSANAADLNGAVTNVEFYQNGLKLGEDSGSPYSLVWSNVGVGSYALTAVAIDNFSARSTSAPVNITVAANAAPNVSLVTPTNNSTFTALTNITLQATATDSDDSIKRVEFFAGVNSIGFVTNTPYSLIWSNVPAGSYTLTARATDNLGASTTSSAVTILVKSCAREFYILTATPSGGGAVLRQPALTPYPCNTMVQLTASPDSGWTFLSWTGDATGANPVAQLLMNEDKCVQAIFGTGLHTNVNGSGTIKMSPATNLYPYGYGVRLMAIPQAGSYFVGWSDGLDNNPRNVSVQSANATFTANFAPITSGFALTVLPEGRGRVVVNPLRNLYTNGSTVFLTNVPEAGQTFTGWSLDASGTSNPLVVVMDQSKTIAAGFTKKPHLEMVTCLGQLSSAGAVLSITGDFGQSYLIEASGNLLPPWTPLGLVTNFFGTAQFTDATMTNQVQRFYRAVLQP